MRILLITPTFHYKDKYPSYLSLSDFPSGFAYIASSLKQAGHEVFGLNPNNIIGYVDSFHMIQDVIVKKVREVNPELIGLGGLCTDYSFLRDAIGVIRKENANIPIVLGGQIVTNDAEFIYDDLRPDWAVVGEGEQAMIDIADCKVSPKSSSILSSVAASCLDSLPFPDYEPFDVREMLDNFSMDTRLMYRYSRPYPRPFNIVASRSCPFSCTFCVHGTDKPEYRVRSIPNVIEEIKVNYERYNFNILIILDELFAVNKRRMKDFCEAVIDAKEQYGWDFDWCFQTHASAKLDLETLKLAKEAGCFFFTYGLESASPVVLKSMNKRTKVEQVIDAMDLAREAKIGFGGNLIFGDIAETQETIAESLAFWLQYCRDTFVFLSGVMPYPGSELFNTARARGMFQNKKEYYEKIDESWPNMTQMSDKTLQVFQSMIRFFEKNWLFVKSASDVSYETESLALCKVWATCPYCGEESMYRVKISNPEDSFMLGTGCVHCNRKIKVEATVRSKNELNPCATS